MAAEMAGVKTVGQCEWADYPFSILEKRWPNVPKWRDIHNLSKEDFYEKTGLQSVDIISGGFPCQPFSTAGKRKGREDDRYLWPEMLRIIRELHPSWVVGENVAGLGSMELENICASLEEIGFEVWPILFPAASIGTLHKRDRFAILAHSNCGGANNSLPKSCTTAPKRSALVCKRARSKSDNIQFEGVDVCKRKQRWDSEPGIRRMADGIPHQVDRLKCLGNAVVPQQFYPIFQAIAEIESF